MTDIPPLDEGATRTVGILQGKVTVGFGEGRGHQARMAGERLGAAVFDAEDRGWLALEAFAGLRFSSAARLVKADVNFAEKGITLPAAKLKTRQRHYIDGLPQNLWQWLRTAPDEAWTLTERQYLGLKSDAFRLAGIRNPGNVLRYSFCSYHVAKHKDAANTAVILCHASPRTLYQHYMGAEGFSREGGGGAWSSVGLCSRDRTGDNRSILGVARGEFGKEFTIGRQEEPEGQRFRSYSLNT